MARHATVCNSGQRRTQLNGYASRMSCEYCSELATVRIPSISNRVCVDHAIEFWTGLVEFAAKDRPVASPVVASEIDPRLKRVSRGRRPSARMD